MPCHNEVTIGVSLTHLTRFDEDIMDGSRIKRVLESTSLSVHDVQPTLSKRWNATKADS